MGNADDMTEQRLSPELIARLGTASDTKLAAEFKVRLGAVKWARTKRNIPAFSYLEALPKNPEFMALLGKVSDMELGRRFECSYATVKVIRERLCIPAYVPSANPDFIAALGTMTDKDVAAKFGYSEGHVCLERSRRGIAAHGRQDPRTSDKEFMSLLGVIPDDELAYRYGCSVNTVRRLRKAHTPKVKKTTAEVAAEWQAKHLSEVIPLLGKMPDVELAKRYGGLSSRYSYLRKKHGIAAFQPEKSGPLESGPERKQQRQQRPAASEARKLSLLRTRQPTYTLPDEVMARLGKVNDRQLSSESGVPFHRIKHYRTWLQIPAYRKRSVIEQELIDSLGKMKDEDVAAKFGRTHSWVRKERKKRGIPGFKFESIPGLIESLGTMHDFEVAEKFGVSSNWVLKTRSERGIPIFNPNKVRASDSDQV